MRPYNPTESNNYLNAHLDNKAYNQSFRPFQTPIEYYQPVQHNQNQHIYFLSSGTAVVKVYKRTSDTTLTEVSTLTDPLTLSYIDSYTAENGIDYDLSVYLRYFNASAIDYPEGIYYIHVKITYADTSTEEFLSEPMSVRAKHKNTVVIRYSHDEDDFGVLFKTLNVHFQIRVHSDFMTLDPVTDSVVYKDQDGNTRSLYEKPNRVWKLNIGGNKGVPEWVVDRINRAFCCGIVSVDNKRYTKNENAKIDQTILRNYPLRILSIELTEYFNDGAGAFVNAQNVQLTDDTSGTFPYVIDNWLMIDTVSGYSLGGGFFEFYDHSTEPYLNEEYYRDFYNDFAVPVHNLQGEFQWNDGLVYVNGPGENFAIVKKATPLTTYLEVTSTVTTTGYPVQYDYSGLGAHITVWGSEAITQYTELGNNLAGNPIIATAQHYFSSTGAKTIRVYTDDKMTVIKFSSSINKITGYDDATGVSSKLRQFVMTSQNIDTDFDMAILSRAKDELRLLNLTGSAIHSILAGFASSLVSGAYKPWKYWRYIYLDNNKFDASAIDDFLVELVDDSDITTGYGIIVMSNQTPPTAPTGTSSAARATLTAKFYSQTY